MQCYAVMKILLKEFIKIRCSPQSQVLCSYFIKTFLFWEFELKDLQFWRRDNFGECIKYLLIKFFNCLREGIIRHYFFPRFNLLSTKLTRKAQTEILQLLDIAIQSDIGIIKECPTLCNIWTKFLTTDGNMENTINNLQRTHLLINDECMMRMHDRLFSTVFDDKEFNFATSRANSMGLVKEIVNISFKSALKDLTIKGIIFSTDINSCTSLQRLGNKDISILHRAANNMISPFDISTCKMWYALILLKTGDYASCLRTVNDVLSCIPPFAMYMSGINRASLEAKILYIDMYFDSDIPMTRKSRTAWLLDLKFGLNDACICPPAVQMELKFVDFRVNVTLSPFVLAYYLTFLCYHELRQYDDRDRALRHVVDVVNDLHQRGNEFYRPMNIAGHCLLMVGGTSRARDMFIRSYEVTLRNPPLDQYNSTLYYLQCLSR